MSFAENQADYWLKTENGKQYLMAKEEVILPCDEATLVGRHNYMNILAATALVQAVGINLEAIRTALRQFKGLDHRFQLAHQANGVRWINDSKATNVDSVVKALESFVQQVILLAGVHDKMTPLEDFMQLVKEHTKAVIFMGEAADRFEMAAKEGKF